MEFYNTTKKTLSLLLVIFYSNLGYGANPFKVTVTEKHDGSIRPSKIEICYDDLLGRGSTRIPSFGLDANNHASPVFDIDFEFTVPTNIPPNGTLFQVWAFVYIKDNLDNLIPLTPLNALPSYSHVVGTTGTINNGLVSLSVNPIFQVLSDCEYYFVFQVSSIASSNRRSGSQSGNSTRSYGGTPSAPNIFSLTSPAIMYTKPGANCIRYSLDPCVEIPAPGPTNTERIGNTKVDIDLKLYPNPSIEGKTLLSIDFPSLASKELSIEILNLQGQVIDREVHFIDSSSRNYEKKLNLQNLAPGIYLIKIKAGLQSKTQKLIIQ
ncbi:MAG: T9SS type A sorting domain-containing protein [Bacteroidota bacterium]